VTVVWREKRFKGADGSDLYYRIAGEQHQRWAILCDGIGCDGYMWRYIIPQLIENEYRVLHWHYPGHGYSGAAPDLSKIGIEDFAGHLRLLCEQLSISQPLLIGHSMGVQVGLQAVRDGLEVEALGLIFGAAGRILDQYGGNDRLGRYLPLIRSAIAAQRDVVRLAWKNLVPTRLGLAVGLLTELNAMRIRPADFMPYLERLSNMDPEVFFAVLARAAEHDARPWLSEIDVPAIILAGDSDSFTPPKLSHAMHAALPDSRLHIIKDASHAGPLEFPEETGLLLQSYLDELAERRENK